MFWLIDIYQNKVSTDQYHVPNRGLRSREIARLFLSWPLTRYWVFDWIAGERDGEHAKAKFRRKLNPDALLTFLPTYSLHNHPWYIAYVISAILGTLVWYGLLKCNYEEKLWNHTLSNHMLTIYHFLSFWSRGKKSSFHLWLIIVIRSSAFRPG